MATREQLLDRVEALVPTMSLTPAEVYVWLDKAMERVWKHRRGSDSEVNRSYTTTDGTKTYTWSTALSTVDPRFVLRMWLEDSNGDFVAELVGPLPLNDVDTQYGWKTFAGTLYLNTDPDGYTLRIWGLKAPNSFVTGGDAASLLSVKGEEAVVHYAAYEAKIQDETPGDDHGSALLKEADRLLTEFIEEQSGTVRQGFRVKFRW